MKLWTIQPEVVYNLLQEKGVFICNSSKSTYPELREAYDWYNAKMEKKIPKPKNFHITDPIWAWHTINWSNSPNEPFFNDMKGSKASVLIEIEIDASEVLLTDYIAWHAVLNKYCLDDTKNEAEWNDFHKWYDNLPYKKRESIMIKSWDKIFDVSPFNNEWIIRGRYIQATFWCLSLNNVKHEWRLDN